MKTCKCGFTGEDDEFVKGKNICLACKRENSKKYYKEGKTVLQKEYYERNKERKIALKKQYYEQINNKIKLYRQENKKQLSLYDKECMENHNNSLLAWGNNKSRDFMLKVNKILDDRPIERVDHSKIVRSTLRIIYAHKKPRAE